jgi:hypothetical protein
MRSALWFWVGILIAFVLQVPFAFADDYPASSGGTTYTLNGLESQGTFGTSSAACDGWYSWMFAQHGGAYPTRVDTCTSTQVCGSKEFTAGTWSSMGCTAINSSGGGYTCPYGGTLSGTTCVGAPACSLYYTRNSSGECIAPSCTAGDSRSGYISASASPTTVVFNGCEAELVNANNQCSVDGVQKICGTWQLTGETGVSGQPVANSGSGGGGGTAPSACPAGQVLQTIGGSQFCGPATADAPATTIDTQQTTNADGTTQTKVTTTTCNGTGCTSTTTTTDRDASGDVTGTSTSTDSVANKANEVQKFCNENPQSSICKISSWAGACGAFTCDGDAVQCAIAREVHQRNCELDAAAAPTTGTVGEAKDALAGVPDPTGSAFRNPTPNALPGMFDTTDLMAASCPAAHSITVLGAELSISVQPVCDLAALIRPLVIGFSLLLGVRIAFSGV